MTKHSLTQEEGIFYPIPDTPHYYINKHTTQVICTSEGFPVMLKQIPNSLGKDNYLLVVIGGKNVFIHRIMAKTFLPNEKEQVNHIDGNKQNNSISNLEWVTPQENAIHAYATGLSDITIHHKEVHQYTLEGRYIASFISDVSAQEATGVVKQNISKVTLGKRPNAGGFLWRRVKLDMVAPCTTDYLHGLTVVGEGVNVSIRIGATGKFYDELTRITGCKGHNIQTRFSKAKGAKVFCGGYMFEKIYYRAPTQ